MITTTKLRYPCDSCRAFCSHTAFRGSTNRARKESLPGRTQREDGCLGLFFSFKGTPKIGKIGLFQSDGSRPTNVITHPRTETGLRAQNLGTSCLEDKSSSVDRFRMMSEFSHKKRSHNCLNKWLWLKGIKVASLPFLCWRVWGINT